MQNHTNNNQAYAAEATAPVSDAVSSEEKNIAIISYITVIGLIIAFVMNNEKKAAFSTYHIKQSLGLVLTALALFVIGMLPVFGWFISFFGSLVLLYLWVMGIVNVINEKKKPVPHLGEKYIEWFKDL